LWGGEGLRLSGSLFSASEGLRPTLVWIGPPALALGVSRPCVGLTALRLFVGIFLGLRPRLLCGGPSALFTASAGEAGPCGMTTRKATATATAVRRFGYNSRYDDPKFCGGGAVGAVRGRGGAGGREVERSDAG